MPILYINCSRSGLSGDMMVAALRDLGVPDNIFQSIASVIQKNLEGIEKFVITFERVPCDGIQASTLNINLTEHSQHRSVKSLEVALNATCSDLNLSLYASNFAREIFSKIIQAECLIHNIQPTDVHLHEIASSDTLFDAIGVAQGLDVLNMLSGECQVFVSDVAVGSGMVKIAHGIVPVPAPATAKIMQQTSLVLRGGPVEKELLTPTGAAILAALKGQSIAIMPRMKLSKVGWGAGTLARIGQASCLAIYVGDVPQVQEGMEEITLLETNIDDLPGEYLGHALDALLDAGALDAYISPVLMKKSRPGQVLHVVCNPQDVSKFLPIIFRETGTLGVRMMQESRICIPRESRIVLLRVGETDYEVHLKIAQQPGGTLGIKPEYEDLRSIAEKENVPVPLLAKRVIAEFMKNGEH